MVRPIMKDIIFLGQKSEETTREDGAVMLDLRHTLNEHRDSCVGMAANMIGYRKRTIIVSVGAVDILMNNPVLISKSEPYETEEGCLSLSGTRNTTRYKNIEVRYQGMFFEEHTEKFSGFVAQVIQHEMDHLEGIII